MREYIQEESDNSFDILRSPENKPYAKLKSESYVGKSESTEKKSLDTWNFNLSHHGSYVGIVSHPELLVGAGKSNIKVLYTVGILCNVEWGIRQLWSSSIILYTNNITGIACNHHTDINPLLLLNMYINLQISSIYPRAQSWLHALKSMSACSNHSCTQKSCAPSCTRKAKTANIKCSSSSGR